ncbi:TetR family transcriptional regulator, partial [Escherichia coli]
VISLWIASGAQEEPEEITDMILTTYNYDYWR